MVEIITAGDAHFELSRADLDREPPHYAVGTLDWLRERYPGEHLAYLMGSDSLRDLPTWHTPQAFVEACDLIGVMRRKGAEGELNHLSKVIPGVLDKLQFLEVPLIEISGSEIRRRVKAREPHRYFLIPQVANYIELHQLYQ
jgi:nicotinate-nucleotide adenylyltransferase